MEVDESLTPWLLTGMGGVLGWGLAQTPPPTTFAIAGRKRPQAWPHVPGVRLDLALPGQFEAGLRELTPSVVVHAACMARVQDCVDAPELARRVNVEAVREWLQTAAAWDSFPLYISSDQVFDGRAEVYHETSAVSPLHLYGRTKAEAESLVLAAGGAVVRLPLLLGPRVAPGRAGADQAILESVRAGRSLSLFADEIRSPIAAALVGPALWKIASRRLAGIFHLAGAEPLSRLALGQEVCAAAGEEPLFAARLARNFEGPPRSLNLVLDSRRTEKLLGWKAPNLRQSLRWISTPPAEAVPKISSQES